ncbi:mechanosensitive ion channel domain-containing protein [Parahaliea mediterranea]|uniref:Small-conductance mechanosensitive channel n=1 Tax=Parahaliea mediterranea TaxID=651086 RepID=A0A939IK69_9GAMM|nr:mechanosensitive ion channel domain-containing protein [Parahaliea mediterranea]MBN7797026.1 mechanosensitive ion channel [Parahaliea mediterranea]
MTPFLELFHGLWPTLTVAAITALIVAAATWVARRSQQGTAGLLYQLMNWIIISLAIIVIVILLPVSDETQGQILSLLGVVLTAVIALSSTTFVSNAMAGVMLHLTQPFRPGDYVRVNQEFGRVTKRSLVHTQIQTEWRDITTLPNLLLVNNPVTVMHRDGTIISAEVSIGYDVAYTRVEELLLQAAEGADLLEPFVLVQELLDHAVLYRVCGFLPEMKHPLSSRSNLRKKVLEHLHGNGVEIVSPAFMNQRQLDPTAAVIPEQPVMHRAQTAAAETPAPEEKIFDKAEEAASLEELKQRQEAARQAVKREKAHLKTVPQEQREAVERRITQLEQQEMRLAERAAAQSQKE